VVTTHVFINRRRIDVAGGEMTGAEILGAGEYGPDYNLFLLQGEGDPTGGEPVEREQTLDVKDSMQFRAIPGNANFGHSGR
jgi:hypothetical protein